MTPHRPTEYPLKARPGARERWLPAWWLRARLRMRLRTAVLQIDRLERALADEFGLLETAALHQELQGLRAWRDDLRERLARLI